MGRHDVGFVSQTGRGTWIGLWGDMSSLVLLERRAGGGGGGINSVICKVEIFSQSIQISNCINTGFKTA